MDIIILAKAFNSVDCRILLQKLEGSGIKGKTLDLLASYSLDRKQCTNFNGCLSEVGSVEYRVAQGSVLGPLLFAHYMNDLPDYFTVLNLQYMQTTPSCAAK